MVLCLEILSHLTDANTIIETPVEDNPDGFDTISVVVFVVHVVHGFCVFSVKGLVICVDLTPTN